MVTSTYISPLLPDTAGYNFSTCLFRPSTTSTYTNTGINGNTGISTYIEALLPDTTGHVFCTCMFPPSTTSTSTFANDILVLRMIISDR